MKNQVLFGAFFLANLFYSQNSIAQHRIAEKIPDVSTIEIEGFLSIDSLHSILNPQKVLVIDPATNKICTISIDSLLKEVTRVFYVENDTVSSTNILNVPQIRFSLTLSPGTYLLESYTELYNDDYTTGGTGVYIVMGSDTLGSASPYIPYSYFGTWSMIKKITITAPATIYFYWECVEPSVASIRKTRLSATKLN